MMSMIQSIIGFALFAVLAWCLSENRKQVNVRLLVSGMAIQLGLGVVLLRFGIVLGYCRGAKQI